MLQAHTVAWRASICRGEVQRTTGEAEKLFFNRQGRSAYNSGNDVLEASNQIAPR